MAEVILSSGARRDLIEIGDYIARDDPVRAASYVEELRAACAALAYFPRRFPRSPRHGSDAHRCIHGNYVIIYDVIDEVVTITAVVHGAREIGAL